MHLCKTAKTFRKMHITKMEKLVTFHIHDLKKQREEIGTEKN